MENLTNYLVEEVLILIPVLLILGKLIKSTLPKKWVRFIPYLLLVVSVVLCFLIIGLTVNAFIQGVIVTGVAVFAHQLVKQPKKSA